MLIYLLLYRRNIPGFDIQKFNLDRKCRPVKGIIFNFIGNIVLETLIIVYRIPLNYKIEIMSLCLMFTLLQICDFLSRIRIFSILDLGSAIRIRITNLSILTNKLFLSYRKYDPGCSSLIRIPGPDLDFLTIPDPGFRGQKGTGSRILDLNH